MGFGGKVKKAFKKAKKVAAKAFSAPNQIASNVIGKIPVVGKPVEQFMRGEGPLGSLEKYLDPGSALVKNFTNNPEDFVKNLGGYKDDLGKIYDYGEGMVAGVKQMINPDKPPEPEKPDAPDYANLWKEYSGWEATTQKARDSSIGMARARLYEAGAKDNVIDAHVTALQGDFDKKVSEYQAGPTYKLLEEGFNIKRGAANNPYKTGPTGNLEAGQGLGAYYRANYASGQSPEDARAAALIRARRAAGGARPNVQTTPAPGGSATASAYDQASGLAPGANPWVSA